MRAALRLVVVAVPMGVLLSRAVAWMSSGRTHAELITRLKGIYPLEPMLSKQRRIISHCDVSPILVINTWNYNHALSNPSECLLSKHSLDTVVVLQIMGWSEATECSMQCWLQIEGFTPLTILMQTLLSL